MPNVTDIKEQKAADIASAKKEGADRSEIKDIRKQAREDIRTARAEKIVGEQAGRYGIDLDNLTKKPLDTNAKSAITEGARKAYGEEFAKGIEGFSEMYAPPSAEQAPTIDKDRLIESARKQRKARWLDALQAFGTGLQGRVMAPEQSLSKQLEAKRGAEFQEYKDITERNRKAREVYQSEYRKDLISWLDKKMADKKTSEAEAAKLQKLKDEAIAAQKRFESEMGFKKGEATAKQKRWEEEKALKERELQLREEGKYYAPKTTAEGKQPTIQPLEGGKYELKNQKTPYTTLYYQLAGNSEKIVNELAKRSEGAILDESGNLKSALRPDQVERLANTLLSRVYTESKDDEGNKIFTPKPGMENFMSDLSESMDSIKPLEDERDKLENEKMLKLRDAYWYQKDDIEAEYATKIADADAKVNEAKGIVDKMLRGEKPKRTVKDIIGQEGIVKSQPTGASAATAENPFAGW